MSLKPYIALAVLGSALSCSMARSQVAPYPVLPPAAAPPADSETVTLLPTTAAATIKGSYLGISCTTPTPALRQQLKLPAGVGLVVDVVAPDSPAAAAGIKQYDVLQKLDDQILINAQQLSVLVRMHKPNDKVALGLIREGQPVTATATLIEKDLAPLEAQEFDPEDMGGPMRMWIQGHGHAGPGAPGGPGMPPIPEELRQFQTGGGLVMSDADGGAVTIRADKDHTMILHNKDGKPDHLRIIENQTGKVIFDASIATEQDRKSIPADVADKVNKMLESLSAATRPSTAP